MRACIFSDSKVTDDNNVRMVAPYFGLATIQIRRSHHETTLMVFFLAFAEVSGRTGLKNVAMSDNEDLIHAYRFSKTAFKRKKNRSYGK